MSLKIDNYESILMTLLDCGYADLELIANVRNDIIVDCLESLDLKHINIHILMREVFYHKKSELQCIIDERIEELKESAELTEEELFELETISSLNPFEDICSCRTFTDISIFFVNNKDIYKQYFANAIESFEKDTGFSLN